MNHRDIPATTDITELAVCLPSLKETTTPHNPEELQGKRVKEMALTFGTLLSSQTTDAHLGQAHPSGSSAPRGNRSNLAGSVHRLDRRSGPAPPHALRPLAGLTESGVPPPGPPSDSRCSFLPSGRRGKTVDRARRGVKSSVGGLPGRCVSPRRRPPRGAASPGAAPGSGRAAGPLRTAPPPRPPPCGCSGRPRPP